MGAKIAAKEQDSILKQLVEALVAIQVSFLIIETPHLCQVLQQLAPNFVWPKRRLMATTASQLYFERKQKSIDKVANLPSETSLCGAIDCWTTKYQTELYLAIVFQWINLNNYVFPKSLVAFKVRILISFAKLFGILTIPPISVNSWCSFRGGAIMELVESFV
ncbi:hypothetical protein O181_028557 [Austropuccinia psidii MF-1]|uniref:Uncharacterized protein n=1 Tax=Austropuccinia psidii MF-1 TaxID=1389203 RepID=A0A9Q3CS51_9BASI|nr:hypothetical protein [Austropuccinia psidii MF-1]